MTDAETAYYARYPGKPVDTDDPYDAMAEKARLAFLAMFRDALIDRIETGADLQSFIGGTMIALVQSVRATSTVSDEAMLRSIQSLWPWAIDCDRLHRGLPPLEDMQ